MPVFRYGTLLVCVVVIGLISGCRDSQSGTPNSSVGQVKVQKTTPPRQLVYDESADAHAMIDKTIAQAGTDGKRILVVFGANWCTECIVLDRYFHEPPAGPIVQANFHVVHLDIGRGNVIKNRDLAKKYKTPLSGGIPVVAVLDSDGKLLHSQKAGEWAPHGLSSLPVVEFLNRWKPSGRTMPRTALQNTAR